MIKSEIFFLLFFRQGNAILTVIGDQIRKLEFERVLPQNIIFDSHFKGGPEDAVQNRNRVLLQTVVVQFNKPCFSEYIVYITFSVFQVFSQKIPVGSKSRLVCRLFELIVHPLEQLFLGDYQPAADV